MDARRTGWVDAALAAAVLLVGVWQGDLGGQAIVVLVSAAAAGLCRRRPAWALGLIWLAAIVQVAVGDGFGAFEIAVLIVGFGTARYGSRATVWAAGASVPAGAAIALGFALARPQSFPEAQLAAVLVRSTGLGLFGSAVVAIGVLAAPWTIGLLLRVQDRYRRAEAAHRVEQARIAAESAAQAAQTQLTREVHDVVGHSLAVIIAQADAARFAATEADPVVREALGRIAEVGRTSLAEVREVLSRTQHDAPAATGNAGLGELVAGVRSAGNAIIESITGTPVALDPATATAAYRVLQELLTNALKYGAPGAAIEVDQVWTADGLALRVANEVAPGSTVGVASGAAVTAGIPGMGLTGMRARLDALGGTMRTGVVRDRFVATVQLPLRAVVR